MYVFNVDFYFRLMALIFWDSIDDIRRKVEDIGCSYWLPKKCVLCKENIIFLCKDGLHDFLY